MADVLWENAFLNHCKLSKVTFVGDDCEQKGWFLKTMYFNW